MTRKVALVTGGAKRIGAETAKVLHQADFDIIVHYCHSVNDAQQLADSLNALRPNSCGLVQGDICNGADITRIQQDTIACFGRLDVLVNNASSFYPTDIATTTDSDWNALIGTNMYAPFMLSKAFLLNLTETQGVIINMCDIHADKPLKNHTLYCMAKSALVTMTQSLALELAPNIRVNAVSPGAILWPENDVTEDEKNTILNNIPLQRLGTPQDIANTIKFLVLDAPYITGQNIAVDGARSLGGK